MAVDPALPCGACGVCATGHRNLCPQVRFAGHGDVDGGLRDLLAWPDAALHPLPDALPLAEATLLEPLGVALHAMDLAHVRLAAVVTVVGCGPIGLLLVQLARTAGATRVVAVEPLAHRRDAALRAGADEAHDPAALMPSGTQASPSPGLGAPGADVVLEVVGSAPAVELAVRAARPGGRVVLVGIPDDDHTAFPASVARRKGLTLAVVRRMGEVYPRATELVARGVVDLSGLVTDRYPLAQAPAALGAAAERRGLKVVVEVGGGVSGELAPPAAEPARRRGAGRRVPPDGVPGAERAAEGQRGHARAGARGRARARLRPNSAARALVTGRSRTLGVLSTSGTLFGPASVLAAVQAAATEHDYAVSVVDVPTLEPEALHRRIALLLRQGVDGIIAVTPVHSSADALLQATAGVPLVAVEGQPEGEVSVVAVDQVQVGRLATQHLLDAGHDTVHHVMGRADFHEAQGRLQGWRATLEEAGRRVPEPLAGDWSPASGHACAPRLADDPDATAVFVANDQMALGLLHGLRHRGRPVPRDVSVVGVDDMPEAAYFDPPLTTVRQDFRELGRRSLAVLLRQVEREDRTVERVLLPPELVVRASVAAPRRPGRFRRAR